MTPSGRSANEQLNVLYTRAETKAGNTHKSKKGEGESNRLTQPKKKKPEGSRPSAQGRSIGKIKKGRGDFQEE